MPNTNKISLIILTLATALLLNACAGKPNSLSEVMVTKDGFAIHGYDPVAYFTQGKAAKGSSEHTFEWNGATWLFSTARHKDLFAQTPEKYAPQYGGWCAYGAASGYATETDPLTSWTLHEDKLYLNYDPGVVEKWSEDIPGYIDQADGKWSKLSGELHQGTATIYWK